MLNNEEAVEQPERQRGDCEEVEGDDRLAVILEKGQPLFTGVATPPNTSQIPSHTPFGDNEAELQQFAVDLGRSPSGVFLRQATNQHTNLFGDLRSAVAPPRTPTPV